MHCMGDATGGWHVHNKEFRLGGVVTEVADRLFTFRPIHGPGMAGAIAEHLMTSEMYNETLVLAVGTRDGYVFDVAAAVARERNLPAVASYNHAADERRFRAQFTMRGAGVPGLADADEAAAFDRDVVEAIQRMGASFDAVVVPTEYVRGQLSAVLSPADLAKVVVAYHGPSAEVFRPRQRAWTGEGPWLHVSRCAVPNALHKNFLWSCELVAAARSAGEPLAEAAELRLCGSGNAESLITEYAVRNGLTDRITVSGVLHQKDLAGLYRESSFLLVPSMMEAGSTTIVEAVLSGCVPVVVDFAGSGEVMRRLGLGDLIVPAESRRAPVSGPDGQVCGHVEFVQPNTEAALAVMRRCLRDAESTNEVMEAAAAIARASFTIEPSVRLLDRALGRMSADMRLLPSFS